MISCQTKIECKIFLEIELHRLQTQTKRGITVSKDD